ncbi:MAG: S16 family serine protease [Egibacteraceae bacterium]
MRRAARLLILPLCLVVLLVAAATVPLPVFVERPGDVVSLVDHVAVAPASPEEAGEVDGDFLLTLVNLRRATVVSLVQAWADADLSVVRATALTGGVDDEVFFERQRELFALTAEVASALGLQAAGLPVEFGAPRGVLVAEVFPGAPAEGVLRPGDIITAVDDTTVPSAGELVTAVRESRDPTLAISFLRDEQERQASIERGSVPGLDQPGLGVHIQELVPPVDLPVPVSVDSGEIGGPSAGLMIALTVYDKISRDDLAAGRRVAGTGGVTVDGAVTPIGGIALKVLAAHRNDVDLFVAPQSQVDQARGAVPDGSTMEVLGAETVQDAIDTLLDRPVSAGGWVPTTVAA